MSTGTLVFVSSATRTPIIFSNKTHHCLQLNLHTRYPHRSTQVRMSEVTEWKTVSSREKRVVLVPHSWHNRTGEVVRQLNEFVWVIERGYIFLGTFDVGGRTTLIKLPNGGLFVHAPLALTKTLKRRIDEIGEVHVVVAPNTEHIDFIEQWKTYYPNARYLGPPKSLARLPKVPFDRELSQNNVSDPKLAGSGLSQFFIACAPFFNETVFVHQPTKSLLCTDLFWNYPTDPDVPRTTLFWGWAMNNVYKPVYDRILVKDRQQFISTLREMLSTEFEQIIPCHGYIVESEGRSCLESFYSGILSS